MKGWPKGVRRVNPEFCTIENCKERTYARGWCRRHYACWLYRGTPEYKPKQPAICRVENCGLKSYVKGLCSFHYCRQQHNIPFDRPKGISGELNHCWKGGIAPYKNQRMMTKNRSIKFEQVKGICEVCNKRKAKKIHHKDLLKTNHAIENLLAVCHKCHGILHKGRICRTSKMIRLYGMTRKDIAQKLCTSINCIDYLHQRGLLQKAITESKPIGYMHHSKYSKLYGATGIQLSKRLKISYPQLIILHCSGKLKEVVENGYYKRTSKIQRTYGKTAKELSKILTCRPAHIYGWHNDLSLPKRLEEKNIAS